MDARKARAIAPGAAGPRATCTVTRDQIGAFCAPAANYRGDLAASAHDRCAAAAVREQDIAAGTVQAMVFGLEMVYIPEGPFTIGDPDPRSVDTFAFYRSDAQGNHAGTLRITSEAAIPVGRAGGLTLLQGRAIQRRSRSGPCLPRFPRARARST